MTHTSTPLTKAERREFVDTRPELYRTATTTAAIVKPMNQVTKMSVR